VFGKALETIEQTVRSNDRVCPYGVSRIAIAFGPDVQAVAPRLLGERLARAIGQGLVGDPQSSPAAPLRVNGGRPGGPARSSPPSPSAVSRHNRNIPCTTLITVDRSVEAAPKAVACYGSSPQALKAWTSSLPPWRHRTVIRSSTLRAPYGTRRDDPRQPDDRQIPLGAVLVVDPDPAAAGSSELAALATCSSAERLGFSARAISQSNGGDLVTTVDGMTLDLVVLMVGAEPTKVNPSWSSSTWCTAAHLTAAYRAAGTDVLAVGAGGGAGALAGCLEQGALVLFDVNAVPGELLELSRTGTVGSDRTISCHRGDLPAPLQALIQLTASERRVLYYLTTGGSAQEIADEIVVSLATVRSHIRSVLRKLGVRSQLAAVALANRRGPILGEPVKVS